MGKYFPLLVFVVALGGIAIMLNNRCKVLESKLLSRANPYIYHDGWCSLTCFDGRCKCHDRCGPLCNTWRELVIDGTIEPTGYEYALTDDAVIKCLLANRKAVR